LDLKIEDRCNQIMKEYEDRITQLETTVQIQVSLAISFVCDDVLCLYGISQVYNIAGLLTSAV
jgi:hypothetical protein